MRGIQIYSFNLKNSEIIVEYRINRFRSLMTLTIIQFTKLHLK